MISKLGLDDWKFAIPAAMLVGIPAISNEVCIHSFVKINTSYIILPPHIFVMRNSLIIL